MLKRVLKSSGISFLGLALALGATNVADSAQIDTDRLTDTIILTGEIETGDYAQIIELFEERGIHRRLILNSPGGSVHEAIKIGNLARELLMICDVPYRHTCNSACVLIAAGCIRRDLTQVGLHRPHFDSEAFGEADFDEASAQYQILMNKVSSHLYAMGLSETVVSIMERTPSTSIHILQGSEVTALIPPIDPTYAEWIISRCGELTDSEKDDLRMISNALAWDRYYSRNQNILRDELGDAGVHAYQAASIAARRLSEGYKEYLNARQREIQQCERSAWAGIAEDRWQNVSIASQ